MRRVASGTCRVESQYGTQPAIEVGTEAITTEADVTFFVRNGMPTDGEDRSPRSFFRQSKHKRARIAHAKAKLKARKRRQ